MPLGDQLLLLATAAAVALAGVRVVVGPSLADRVVGLDLAALAGVALMLAAAITFDLPVLIDVGIVMALISFISTAAFASYLERRRRE